MDALEFLQCLVNQPLCYALKSPDMDLYDFGFGDFANNMNAYSGERKACTFILHVTCRFKVIWQTREKRVDKYYEDTPCEKFHSEVEQLIGLKVRRVALSDKNDLWLDLGDYWIVFATLENREESWRFFASDIDIPHLIASDSRLHFDTI